MMSSIIENNDFISQKEDEIYQMKMDLFEIKKKVEMLDLHS